MNKKMYYFAIIPWGAVAVLLWLYIKTIRHEFDKKIFASLDKRCLLFGFLSMFFGVCLSALPMRLINSFIDISDFAHTYGMLIADIIGGYLMNLFSFRSMYKSGVFDNMFDRELSRSIWDVLNQK